MKYLFINLPLSIDVLNSVMNKVLTLILTHSLLYVLWCWIYRYNRASSAACCYTTVQLKTLIICNRPASACNSWKKRLIILPRIAMNGDVDCDWPESPGLTSCLRSKTSTKAQPDWITRQLSIGMYLYYIAVSLFFSLTGYKVCFWYTADFTTQTSIPCEICVQRKL